MVQALPRAIVQAIFQGQLRIAKNLSDLPQVAHKLFVRRKFLAHFFEPSPAVQTLFR